MTVPRKIPIHIQEKERLQENNTIYDSWVHYIFPDRILMSTPTQMKRLWNRISTTCVKLTIVTHLSFSERIAIANISF